MDVVATSKNKISVKLDWSAIWQRKLIQDHVTQTLHLIGISKVCRQKLKIRLVHRERPEHFYCTLCVPQLSCNYMSFHKNYKTLFLEGMAKYLLLLLLEFMKYSIIKSIDCVVSYVINM